MDKEKVKQSITDFENEDYMSSKEIIRGEIKDKIDSHLKDTLGLENDIDDSGDE